MTDRMLLLIPVALVAGAFVLIVLLNHWVNVKTLRTVSKRFRCLRCGHDITESNVVECPACGDPHALDPDRHPTPVYDLLDADVPWAVPNNRRRAERNEYKRRVLALERAAQEKFISKTGRAMSPLRPSGVVEIGGCRVNARSEQGFIIAGTQVVVLGTDANCLLVREVE